MIKEQRIGYTIQEVVEKSGVSAHTLRYYERINLLPEIERAENGYRRYSDDDLGWVHFLTILRNTGMPIQTMQHYVVLERSGDATLSDRLQLLADHQSEIENHIETLQNHLGAIERKVAHYQSIINGEEPVPCE